MKKKFHKPSKQIQEVRRRLTLVSDWPKRCLFVDRRTKRERKSIGRIWVWGQIDDFASVVYLISFRRKNKYERSKIFSSLSRNVESQDETTSNNFSSFSFFLFNQQNSNGKIYFSTRIDDETLICRIFHQRHRRIIEVRQKIEQISTREKRKTWPAFSSPSSFLRRTSSTKQNKIKTRDTKRSERTQLFLSESENKMEILQIDEEKKKFNQIYSTEFNDVIIYISCRSNNWRENCRRFFH